MRKLTFLKKVAGICTLFAFALSTFTGYSQEPKWEVVEPKYETHDVFVAAINVMDHGADSTGQTDQTALFQRLLEVLGNRRNDGIFLQQEGRIGVDYGVYRDTIDGVPYAYVVDIDNGDFILDDNGEKIRINDQGFILKDNGVDERGERIKLGAQANRNGGVLFVPEGKYLFNGSLTLPKGVTIRGEWEKPVKGQPIKGTILMPTRGRKNDAVTSLTWEAWSFIIMQPSSAVMDLNIWYPNQNADEIVAYPPAILFGEGGYWGNDYTLASNITLVNAYDGVIFSRRSGGGAPNCYGIYGTPLRRGIEIDNIAEVGRVDNVDFSAEYWAGSGLTGSPSVDAIKDYLYNNATAVTMRRNDWSFIGNVKADGYNVGYRMALSYNDDQNGNKTAPNGHNYGMEFTNCKYGVYAEAVADAGMMFYGYKFINCDFGFYLKDNPRGVLQIQGCEFDTKIASIYAPTTSRTKIMMNQNIISSGPVDIRGGLLSIIGCEFNNEPEQMRLGDNVKATILGNTFANDPEIKNVSKYECIIDHSPIEMTELPKFPYKNQYEFTQKPSGSAYYLATTNGVSVDADDNSAALQTLLDKTKNEGGGLVYLPPGRYKFRQPITIPSGVELKGSMDIPAVPTGPGTSMEIYAGKGEENGTPFISMEANSGIRGLVMNYPEQKVQLLTNPDLNEGDVYKYPYTIRGNANVYIVNIGLRAVYNGIDLFTNKCDNHFIDYLAGHVFRTGIRVGGGSKGGHIYNSQFNQIAYGSGGETKFGAWPNSPDNDRVDRDEYSREHAMAYAYCWNNLEFIILGDCEDQVMFNNFDFGSNNGFKLSAIDGNGPSGISLGQGIDQGMKSVVIEAVGEKGFNFINSQLVTTPANEYVLATYKNSNRYIQTTENFDGLVTFFGTDFWGDGRIANELLGGTVEMQAGNYANPGNQFTSIATEAEFDIIGSNINNIQNLISAESTPQFFIQASMLNKGNATIENAGLWYNNIDFEMKLVPGGGAFMDRTGWIATASLRNERANDALDANTSTIWAAGVEQASGQWFMVDMRKEQTFTGIYLDSGSNMTPTAYTVSISNDSIEWTSIATGRNVANVEFDTTQKARYIKVELTTSNRNIWRIAEFHVENKDLPCIDCTSIEDIISQENNEVNVWFTQDQLNVSGTTGSSIVKLYTISGQQIASPAVLENSTSINLSSGIYIVVIENNGNVYRKKVIKR